MTEPELARAVDALKMLWEEYRYQHELCWQVPILTTAAAVILATLPYAQCQLVPVLGKTILLAPSLGVVLTGFVMSVMARELERLRAFRDRYRELQTPVLGVWPAPKHRPSWFTFDARVWGYLVILGFLQLMNIFIVICYWIPQIETACKP